MLNKKGRSQNTSTRLYPFATSDKSYFFYALSSIYAKKEKAYYSSVSPRIHTGF